jgi:shikimate 5-dehydrogenase
MSDSVDYRVVMIGHPLQRTALGDAHAEAFAKQGLPLHYEQLDVPPVNFHRELTNLLRDPSFLGAKIVAPYKQTVLAYCQELAHAAQGIGAVNTLVRRPSGLIVGDNTEVPAFVRCLTDQGVTRVRTGLILGAGGAARVALAGLRELGCARYMVGFRHPRRTTELASQFKGIRRQLTFFPLNEMTEFFDWAAESDVFSRGVPMPAPEPESAAARKRKQANGNSQRGRGWQVSDDGIKRLNLLVIASPVGIDGGETTALINTVTFMRCFERVLEMIPTTTPTPLMQLAESAGVPVISGYRLQELQAECSRELWIREYRRHESGEPAPVEPEPVKQMTVRRRRRG